MLSVAEPSLVISVVPSLSDSPLSPLHPAVISPAATTTPSPSSRTLSTTVRARAGAAATVAPQNGHAVSVSRT